MPRKQRPSVKRLRRRRIRITRGRLPYVTPTWAELRREPDFPQSNEDIEAIAWLVNCGVPPIQLTRVTTETCHKTLAYVLEADIETVKPIFDLQVKQGTRMLTALVNTLKALG